MKLRHASFFSGVGGLDLGFERAGIETVSLSEFDPYASAVLAERFPGVRNLGDITKIDEKEVPDAEIWSGGFPCQDLSVAGKRKGFDGGTRSSLAFTFIDLVERRRPRWVVLENVAGLLSSNGGRDFGRLLREMVGLGYGLGWRTMDAQHFGVAQRRRRVFIIAALDEAFGGLGGDRAAEVLFECEGSCGHIGKSAEEGKETPGASLPGIGIRREQSSSTNPDRIGVANGMAERLDDREEMEDSRSEMTKVYSIREDAKANNFSATEIEVANALSAVRAGEQSHHAQPFIVSVYRKSSRVRSAETPETWVDDGIANTLNTFDVGDIRTTHAVLGTARQDQIDDEHLPQALDGHRYRVIGNGVVAPVAEFIGRRIVEVDAKWKKEALDER